jgi:acyl CoA:acetate/3-ketoacid CoA transferase alpha subunit
MTVPLPEASAKKVFMLADIISAVKNSLADKTHTAVKEGDTCVITAAAGDTVCTLIFDSNGSIMSAEITANGKNTVFNVEEISQSAESSAAPVSSQPASSEINSN